LSDNKKKIEDKLHELDEMLADLDVDEEVKTNDTLPKSKIDIKGLDVVDVLHNILN